MLLPGFVENSKQHLCVVPIYLLFKHFVKVPLAKPYSSMDMASIWEDFCFILSERLDFHIVNNLPIAIHAFPVYMLTSFSVDEILPLLLTEYQFLGEKNVMSHTNI